MRMPRITIVTPSYNQAAFLEATIRSVIGQGYPNLEYIIMDGGSTDGSVEIIRRYERHLYHWVSRKDNGQADAISQGFIRSTGDVLGWLNSDDMLMPGALLRVGREFAVEVPPIGLSGACVYVDEKGSPFMVHRPISRSLTGMLLLGHGCAQMSTFWLKRAYDKVGGLDVTMHYSFDYELFVRLRAIGSIRRIPDYLSLFRLHEGSKTRRLYSTCVMEDLAILNRHGMKWVRGLAFLSPYLRRLNPGGRLCNRIAWLCDRRKVTATYAQWLETVLCRDPSQRPGSFHRMAAHESDIGRESRVVEPATLSGQSFEPCKAADRGHT